MGILRVRTIQGAYTQSKHKVNQLHMQVDVSHGKQFQDPDIGRDVNEGRRNAEKCIDNRKLVHSIEFGSDDCKRAIGNQSYRIL